MSDPQVLKPDKDYKPILDEQFPKLEELAQTDLNGAVEQLTVLEKQTRQASDMNSTARILVEICELCKKQGDLALLNEQIQVLSKKHGQLKGAITRMVQRCIDMLGEMEAEADKLELIETLRKVTDGKIYVEVERARVTRTLSQLKEQKGEVKEAQEILTSLQVETFGSMDKREKTEFILEQVRLTLAQQDYQLAHILSRKISTKVFEEETFHDLKLRFYELMIRIGLHNDEYLDITRYYHHVLTTPSVAEDASKWQDILANVVYFIILSPYDNEQSDFLHRIAADKRLLELPMHNELIKCFTTRELMRWPRIEEIYGVHLRKTPVFTSGDARAEQRYAALKTRVIEHNIRVVSAYYARITLPRLQQLLDLSPEETEKQLSALVSNKSVHARIDRPAQLVVFGKAKKSDEVLKAWSFDVGKLLSGIEKVRQLVQKEYTLQTVQQKS
ncbi:PCI domain-domain-containing protein [Protomyces lactucae-debilis]|uniref:PCI domain-domain-containing protein n=1 Tax=Protomyces lactucae-debilis TaxID=2754530 RepID=A0A1Y2EYC9_PROLT|nr:PCI domain-containing protein [Protomyces lactucae-debilis]ORY76609.1 PCI domain-domain-containing protein [Protomyces lactucae-debilis]